MFSLLPCLWCHKISRRPRAHAYQRPTEASGVFKILTTRKIVLSSYFLFSFVFPAQTTPKTTNTWGQQTALLGPMRVIRDLQIRLRQRLRVRVFQCVPDMRMCDCVRLSRQLVLFSKSRRRLDVNNEIFNKSHPPTTSSLQVQERVKRLVFKGADTLWNVPCNLSCNVLATLWHLVLFFY